MLFGMICGALAYDEEITFQDIPWGSSASEVEKILKEKYGNHLLQFTTFNFEAENHATLISENFNDQSESPVNTVIGYCLLVDEKTDGYNTPTISFTFFYPAGDKEALSLNSVIISMEVDNLEEAYNDIAAKLTQKYGGDPLILGTTGFDNLTLPSYRWIGKDSFIDIEMAQTILMTDGIQLRYIKALDPNDHTFDVAPSK